VKVILLGYEFWQRTFNGDTQIIGKTVRISRWDVPPTNYNVNALVDFWSPAEPNLKYMKDPDWNVVARLKDRVTPQQGQAELGVLTTREAQSEKQFEGFQPQLQSLTDEMNQDAGAFCCRCLVRPR
jgi:putative ABC transport system permease protein